MLKMKVFKNRDDWLRGRKTYIGGSDAACIIGLDPYKTNVELWEFKTGRKQQEDISGKPYVKYGTDAEKYLRELFKLDFPQFKVGYYEYNFCTNDKYPWAHASLDGWLTDENGRRGILEIKTTNIQSQQQKMKWENQIPDNYFVQVLHYLMVTEFDFAILKAQLKWERDDDVFCVTKHYRIERSDVEADFELLENSEKAFYEFIKSDIQPPLILPEI